MKKTEETPPAAHGGHRRGALSGNTFLQVMRHRNYLLYAVGDGVSLIGSWTQRVAIAWLTWELTHSGLWLGIIVFADLFPAVILSPIGGVIADRSDPKRMTMITQSFAMLQSVVLFLLTWLGFIDMILLVALAAIRGMLSAINQPARMSLVPSLVPREDLTGALAINSIQFNTARFIGPAIAGAVIVAGGIESAFAINAATYLILLWALWVIDVKPQKREPGGRRGMVSQIGDGYTYVSAHPGIGPLLLIFASVTVLARPAIELLPGFADGIFGQGPQGLAWMTSMVGLGAMVGGASMVRRSDTEKLVMSAVGSILLLSACTLAFAIVPSFWAALAILFVFGFTNSTSGIGTQTLIQSAVDDAMRGRVMSLYGVIFRGGPAVGALLIGVASEHWGIQIPVAIGGALCIGVSIWALTQRQTLASHLNKPGDRAA